jgi:LacI family transcriptional regulator
MNAVPTRGNQHERTHRRGPAPASQVNIRDVARHAGVSVATVSRVMSSSDLVSDRTRDRVLASIAELGFVINGHARALAGHGTPIIALVANEIFGPSFSVLARGVEQLATERSHLFVMCTTQHSADRAAEVVRMLQQQRPAAVLWLGPLEDDPLQEDRVAQHAETLRQVGTRLVICGRSPLRAAPNIGSVDYDNFGGARAITEHLITLGHRDILFAGARPRHLSSQRRLEGYLSAMEAAGLPTPAALTPPGDFTAESGRQAIREALQKGTSFTAVAAVVDSVALGVIQELANAGLKVPQDVSVTGFDDIDALPGLELGLTTATVPFEDVGRTAAEIALDGDHSTPAHINLPVTMHVRTTTSAPRTAAPKSRHPHRRSNARGPRSTP